MYWSTTLPIRGAANQFVYSSGGTVSASSSAPADADWAVVSNFYDSAWSRNSSAKLFTYSYNGSILQASDPMSIPPDAAWATISSFKIEGTGGNYPIKDTLFKYSVNGTDILTASDPNSIPANAQWATLVSFNDAWKQTSSETYSAYTLNRISPQAVSLTVASDNGNPSLAKPGSLVSVSLQTDLAIKQPAIVIGGSGATVSGERDELDRHADAGRHDRRGAARGIRGILRDRRRARPGRRRNDGRFDGDRGQDRADDNLYADADRSDEVGRRRRRHGDGRIVRRSREEMGERHARRELLRQSRDGADEQLRRDRERHLHDLCQRWGRERACKRADGRQYRPRAADRHGDAKHDGTDERGCRLRRDGRG
ncbi:hypothetical protein [Cohnella rhizosphaerae]|uniref:Uncharacterized protein n=1 Tax=Cohnella rhizosphaerae TaxID=1457232 RepID=A0A9X4KR12_9BACL|nr:hypothetical protein [Cohnella rhizosphaerae]MDG0809073.1 hypothetical protein [Cohnella rhizosphaerae]